LEKGLHFIILFIAISNPLYGPYLEMASLAYWGQLG